MQEVVHSLSYKGIEAKVYQLYESKSAPAIFYFHGGGFIFGLANDLPDALVEEIIGSGYQLFCFEYPLAPELALKEIVDFTNYAVHTMAQKLRSMQVDRIVCMGRSAGAYLAAAAVSHVPAEFSRGLFFTLRTVRARHANLIRKTRCGL